jgi:D-alanyl-D-alanine carboxypeptidase
VLCIHRPSKCAWPLVMLTTVLSGAGPCAAAQSAPAQSAIEQSAATQSAATLEPAVAQGVDEAAVEWLESTKAPSVSIAIVERGAVVLAKAYGLARLDPPTPAGAGTRYAIDSVSKEFTAAAILLLAQQGKLSLDDPLGKWFAGLGAASGATLRQLLTHTSGIRDYWPEDFATPQMMKPTTSPAIIQEWASRPLDFEPGTDWQYSNTGYVLAGTVVERVSGVPLFEFERRHIFLPLRMARVAEYSAPQAAQDAAGYTRYGLGPLHAAPKEAKGWLFGAADLAMEPKDLALWDISLIDRSLLSEHSYAAQCAPVVLKDGTRRPYGLGLHIDTDPAGRLRLGHTGAGSGFLADNRIWPHARIAIVTLTNNDWASPEDLVDRIAFLVLPPTPAQARARALFEAFQNGTVDRTRFTAAGRFYLTDEALAELRASLSPLGPARLIQLEREEKRGGMTTRVWKILCRGARLEATERAYPDGELAQFMIVKRED